MFEIIYILGAHVLIICAPIVLIINNRKNLKKPTEFCWLLITFLILKS